MAVPWILVESSCFLASGGLPSMVCHMYFDWLVCHLFILITSNIGFKISEMFGEHKCMCGYNGLMTLYAWANRHCSEVDLPHSRSTTLKTCPLTGVVVFKKCVITEEEPWTSKILALSHPAFWTTADDLVLYTMGDQGTVLKGLFLSSFPLLPDCPFITFARTIWCQISPAPLEYVPLAGSQRKIGLEIINNWIPIFATPTHLIIKWLIDLCVLTCLCSSKYVFCNYCAEEMVCFVPPFPEFHSTAC